MCYRTITGGAVGNKNAFKNGAMRRIGGHGLLINIHSTNTPHLLHVDGVECTREAATSPPVRFFARR